MAKVPINRFPKDFRKVNWKTLRPIMDKSGDKLRRDARTGMSDLAPPGPLERAFGKDGERVKHRLESAKHRARNTECWLKEPRRKKDRFFVFGATHKIGTAAQCYKLRHKAVKAGLFSKKVLHLPPFVPPFAVGSTYIQPRRNPYHVSRLTLDEVTEDVLDTILGEWGFD